MKYFDFNQNYSQEEYRKASHYPIDGFFRRHYRFNQDNIITINDLIDKLFDNYSKILPIRVDLYYQTVYNAAYEMDEIKSLFTKLRNNMRHNRLFEHCITYLAKLEYAERRGWHYHVCFFFNGQEIQDDYYYANAICQYWRNVIAKGHGGAHSSNMNNRYQDDVIDELFELDDDEEELNATYSSRQNALGKVIDYCDDELIFKLRQSLYYLAKEMPEHLEAKFEYGRHFRYLNAGQILLKKSRGRKRSVYARNPEQIRQLDYFRERGIISSSCYR